MLWEAERTGEAGMKRNVPVQSLIDHIKTAVDVDPWAKEMAEKLLKEKEAVKPEWYRGKPYCGACGAEARGGKFCSECGKPILWEGR